ncbi:MAG: hypothetical protein WC289_00725 [Patescibacteria group bacterium]|jgi:hypothetical protein
MRFHIDEIKRTRWQFISWIIAVAWYALSVILLVFTFFVVVVSGEITISSKAGFLLVLFLQIIVLLVTLFAVWRIYGWAQWITIGVALLSIASAIFSTQMNLGTIIDVLICALYIMVFQQLRKTVTPQVPASSE